MTEQAAEQSTEQPQAGEQEPFDGEFDAPRAARLVSELRSEVKAAKEKAKANADAAARLASIEESQKTETQRLTEERDALRAERDTVQAEAMRTRVAFNKGLPVDLADRLRGATEDELSEDADRLLELVKPAGPQRPYGDVAQGARTTSAPTTADMFAAAIDGSFTR